MGSRERLASRIPRSVLQWSPGYLAPLYSSRKDNGPPTARPAPWHGAPPLILTFLSNQCPSTFLPSLLPPPPLHSALRSNRLTGSLGLECPYCSLCLLRSSSSHFPRSSMSTASSISPSVHSQTIVLSVSLPHVVLCFLLNAVDDVFVDGNSHHLQGTQPVAGTEPSPLWELSPFNPFTNPGSRCSDPFSQIRKWKLRQVQRDVPKVTQLVSGRAGI